MLFGKPVWNSKQNVYIIQILEAENFSLKGEPQFVDMSSNDLSIEYPDINNDSFKSIQEKFIQELIQKDKESNWFAKPLREASILRRLEHNWKGDSVKTSGWFTATWIPISLEITPSSFILSWSILKFEESNPRISSRFLSLSEPPTPRSQSPDSLQKVERSPPIRQFVYQPQESNDLEQIYDIPLSTDSNEIDLEEQRKERQSIREARLRVEVAQMKLEKYLQNYYRKYGDIPDESDSETSSLEDSD